MSFSQLFLHRKIWCWYTELAFNSWVGIKHFLTAVWGRYVLRQPGLRFRMIWSNQVAQITPYRSSVLFNRSVTEYSNWLINVSSDGSDLLAETSSAPISDWFFYFHICISNELTLFWLGVQLLRTSPAMTTAFLVSGWKLELFEIGLEPPRLNPHVNDSPPDSLDVAQAFPPLRLRFHLPPGLNPRWGY